MKYSLRSLMIVVTLVAVMLGIRVEYLRRWAAFHERKAANVKSRVGRLAEFDFEIWDGDDLRLHDYHQRLATEYRAAVCRPWNFVKKPRPVEEMERSESRKAHKLPTSSAPAPNPPKNQSGPHPDP